MTPGLPTALSGPIVLSGAIAPSGPTVPERSDCA